MRAVQLLIGDGNATAEPIIMKQRVPGEELEPSLSISIEAAQTLMDDLWQCGLRPTEGVGSAGAMLATQNHLKDLQRIIFEPKHNAP